MEKTGKPKWDESSLLGGVRLMQHARQGTTEAPWAQKDIPWMLIEYAVKLADAALAYYATSAMSGAVIDDESEKLGVPDVYVRMLQELMDQQREGAREDFNTALRNYALMLSAEAK